ncbi:hypothetical protein LFM09_30525 [Lentzea alba]|uniref:hypothetical protein n=1 Tax=Lentzea alba TaxID=2714351 RepID=UPI0039BF4E43
MNRWRRSVLSVTVAAVAFGVVTAPAQADDHVPSTTLTRAEWGYVDLATPNRAHLNPAGDAPVGAWPRNHVSRSYFRFDLGGLRSADVLGATLTGKETAAGDCAERAVQVWRTEPLTTKSSWLRPPKERELLATAGPAQQCPADPMTFDLTAAIKAAVQRGESAVTLELRVPKAQERDQGYGRRVANDLKLVVSHNKPPNVPVGLEIQRQRDPNLPCDPVSPGTYVNPARLTDGGVVFQAKVTDPDPGDVLEAEYSTWPVADPAARQSVRWPVREDGSTTAQVSEWYQTEGTYAWTVRAHDGTASSAETAPCYLTVDRTRPEPATVTSAAYPPGWDPHGGIGVAGEFTFASTSTDVATYRYRFSGQSDFAVVRPAELGGPATVSFTPQNSGTNSVEVYAVDRAGNHANWSTFYSFTVLESRPIVFSGMYPDNGTNYEGGPGVPGDFEFSSWLQDVASYAYSFNGDPEQTVAGRTATVTFTPTKGDINVLKVQSVSSTGERSLTREYRFKVDSAPRVAIDRAKVGSVSQITLTPRLPGTVEYRYWFTHRDGTATEPVIVPAGPDGTATSAWTPTTDKIDVLHATSRDAAGTVSTETYFSFMVDGVAPYLTLTGAEHPEQQGTITFNTQMENPVEYEYWFSYDRETKHRVAAGSDGKATATFVPPVAGYQHVLARVRNAAGIWSAEGSQAFNVSDIPDVTSAEFPENRTVPWRSGSFTLKSNQPGAAEFVYKIDGVEHTAPVGADGTATFDWTPTRAGGTYLVVNTRTATGARSLENWYYFTILEP